jgi:5-formyltetrahydrofolate cyclo-ligase
VFTKAETRQSLGNIAARPECHGRLAQSLRQLDSYHAARQLFISPAPILAQIRINALNDGKEIIMPGPGLKDGLYLLKPFSVPFPKLAFAVSNKGLPQFGRLLTAGDLGGLALDMLITDACAVDEQGTRLGDGLGFFDLSCAILAAHKALARSCVNYAVLDDPRRLIPEMLSYDDWDVKMNGVITPAGCRDLHTGVEHNSPLFWDILPPKRIKRLKPLWELRRSAT